MSDLDDLSGDSPRVLGVDPGQARIGLALSDPLRVTAQPLPKLDCVGPKKDLNRIADLVRERNVTTVVIGLPLSLDGSDGPAAVASREMAEGLSRRLHGVEILLWDERLTTVVAERTMVAANVRRKKRRDNVDSVAAALILQNWLDAQASL